MKNFVYILIVLLILGLVGYVVLSPEENSEKYDPVTNKEKSNTSQYEDKFMDYSPEKLEELLGDKRILLFFHADWCTTCRVAVKDITKNHSELPNDLVVLKLDYDTNLDLRKTYKLTSQHAFVLLDSQGEMETKWYGGGVKTILENIN